VRQILIDDIRDFHIVDRIARTYADGIQALEHEGPWDVLWLDHDLGRDPSPALDRYWNGHDVLVWIEEHKEFMPRAVVCVSGNPSGRERIERGIQRMYGRTFTADDIREMEAGGADLS
jgi:hypothetical protein